MPTLSHNALRRIITDLASIHRPSASPGEQHAAERIAELLGAMGVRCRLQQGPAHGEYFRPLALLCAAGAAAGLIGRRSRPAAATLAGLAAAGIYDDVTGGRMLFRRLLGRRQTTTNVIGQIGADDAEQTVVIVAHHDAARSGLIFNPALAEIADRLSPGDVTERDESPPVMYPVIGGPLLACAGALTGSRLLAGLGTVVSAGAAAAFADIGCRQVVPGANDNLTGVATLAGVAANLQDLDLTRTRVLLVSTGAEESFMEGMRIFAEREFCGLDRDRTFILTVDTVGSAHLCQLKAEGMLKLFEYPQAAQDAVSRAAAVQGVTLRDGVTLRNATDGLYAAKAGFISATLASFDDNGAPANYHWPTDTPENVDYATLTDAICLCSQLICTLDQQGMEVALHGRANVQDQAVARTVSV